LKATHAKLQHNHIKCLCFQNVVLPYARAVNIIFRYNEFLQPCIFILY